MIKIMKLTLQCAAVLAIGTLAVGVYAEEAPVATKAEAPAAKEEASILKDEKAKVSYSIGTQMGKSLKVPGLEIDLDVLIQGLKDTVTGVKPLMTEEEVMKTMTAFMAEMRQKQMAVMQKAGEENKKAGEAFLAENKTKEGVVTLPSGLQYKILKAGDGKKPTLTDSVECQYKGTLLDGTEFDSSYKRGQATTFQVATIIPAWKEALQIMPVGSKWQLFVPSDLGYGPRGNGQVIGPNSTLIFELELLAIK